MGCVLCMAQNMVNAIKKLSVRLTQTIATSSLVIDSRKQLGNTTTYSACLQYQAPPVWYFLNVYIFTLLVVAIHSWGIWTMYCIIFVWSHSDMGTKSNILLSSSSPMSELIVLLFVLSLLTPSYIIMSEFDYRCKGHNYLEFFPISHLFTSVRLVSTVF